MISIKRHIEGLEVSRDALVAYQSLVDGILGLTAERLPRKDAVERRKFKKKLKSESQKLRKSGTSLEIIAAGDQLLQSIEGQWNAAAANAVEREKELLEIIALLSETASRLDQTNQDFYKNLHQSIHSLEAIGKLDDLSRVRRELSEHVKRLEATVGHQERKTTAAMRSFQGSLSTAERRAKVVSRLVSSDPLKALPTRRHAEEFLAGLIQQEKEFAVGVVLIDRLDRVVRRYGDEAGEQIVRRFSTSLRERLPVKIHLYRWEDCSFTAFSSHVLKKELQEILASFLQLESSRSFETGGKTTRAVTIEPRCVVHQVTPPADASKVLRLIEQFCETAVE